MNSFISPIYRPMGDESEAALAEMVLRTIRFQMRYPKQVPTWAGGKMTSISTQTYAAIAVQTLYSNQSSQNIAPQVQKSEERGPSKDEAVFSSAALEIADAEDLAISSEGPQEDTDLSQEEKEQVNKLKSRDAEVKAHEQAHLGALAGQGGSANYEYTTGPDGRRYATGGEVPVSIGESSGGPRDTIRKAQQVARAAVAPAQPSGADQAARAKAQQVEAKARQELREKQRSGDDNEDEDHDKTADALGGSAASSASGLIDSAAVSSNKKSHDDSDSDDDNEAEDESKDNIEIESDHDSDDDAKDDSNDDLESNPLVS